MSAWDNRVCFYQANDITDPTPYEDEPEQWHDLECSLCRKPIYRGEEIVLINHDALACSLAVHRKCVWVSVNKDLKQYKTFLTTLEDMKFELEEGVVPEQ